METGHPLSGELGLLPVGHGPVAFGLLVVTGGTQGDRRLHGVPGLAFVVVRRAALDAGCAPPRGVYLDLRNACRHQDARGTAFTPAIPAFYALRESLAELAEQGGWRVRRAQYARLAERVREGLARAGVSAYLPPESSSVVLRSYHLPKGVRYADLHDGLKARGFVIYAGQGGLVEDLFRISTMGEIRDGDLDRLLAAFEEVALDHPPAK